MSNKTLPLTPSLYRYLLEHSLRESDVLQQLREQTRQIPMSQMQISPEQGQFMTLLVQLIKARKAIEIGVFTGYSSLCIAAGLGGDGRLIACDIDAEVTKLAQSAWRQAGVIDQIDLRIGAARQTLQSLLDQGQSASFDFVFIDADKVNYAAYYELALALLRVGGLMLIDNALWSGAVADPDINDEDTQAIRSLNDKIHRDTRVMASLLPVGDGINIVLKR